MDPGTYNALFGEELGHEPSQAISKTYQSAVGGLMYIAMGTRPDIAFAVGILS